MEMYLGSTREPNKRKSNPLGMFSPSNFHLQQQIRKAKSLLNKSRFHNVESSLDPWLTPEGGCVFEGRGPHPNASYLCFWGENKPRDQRSSSLHTAAVRLISSTQLNRAESKSRRGTRRGKTYLEQKPRISSDSLLRQRRLAGWLAHHGRLWSDRR